MCVRLRGSNHMYALRAHGCNRKCPIATLQLRTENPNHTCELQTLQVCTCENELLQTHFISV